MLYAPAPINAISKWPMLSSSFLYFLSNSNVTCYDITTKPLKKYFDIVQISQNPNLSWDIVKKHPKLKWNYYELSKNPCITWDIVKTMPKKNGVLKL